MAGGRISRPWLLLPTINDLNMYHVLMFMDLQFGPGACKGNQTTRDLSKASAGPAPAAVIDAGKLMFGLSGAMSVHGQKHIWDNISGDVLQLLRHYNTFKAGPGAGRGPELIHIP